MPNLKTFFADERRVTLVALMIVFLLSALDQTIVSTAMPRIVSELHGLNLYAWVTTAYLLTSTVGVPIWGKMSDLFGRKPVLLAGVLIFLAASWLAGLSATMGQLIFFRAIQGIGGGALFTTAFTIIADLFDPRERARFGGLFGLVFGVASVVGPVVGGFFTDHGTMHVFGQTIAGWRWVFYLNLPLSAIALTMIIAKMPRLAQQGGGPIDFLGAGLLIATFTPLLLALGWGGHDYAWGSVQIVGLLTGSAVGLIAFIFIESRVREPIVPLGLFANPTFSIVNLAGFVLSMAFMGVVAFLPLFLQVGMGVRATTSGLAMLPMMLGLLTSAMVTGRLVARIGRYKPFLLGGAGVMLFGLVLLCFVGPHTSLPDLGWRLLIVGVGTGPSQSLFSMAVQNAVSPREIGVATSSSQFFRQIGSTVGVAVFGAILTHSINDELARRAPRVSAAAHQTLDIAKLQAIALSRASGAVTNAAGPSPAMQQATADSFGAAIRTVFLVAIGMLIAALGLMCFIPNLEMVARSGAAARAEASLPPQGAPTANAPVNDAASAGHG